MGSSARTQTKTETKVVRLVRDRRAMRKYVTLPDEAHGYSARESVEDVLAEMLNWFDKFVKDAVPGEAKTAATLKTTN